MKKVFISILCILILTSLACGVYADSKDGNEFMSIYAGEGGKETSTLWSYLYKEQDAISFAWALKGWTNQTWNQTLYNAKGQKSYIKGSYNGAETDILYWTSHGLSSGVMSYWNGGDYVNYNQSNWKGVDEVGNTTVAWNSSSGYKTNSNWNSDMEWAIIAACSQFANNDLRNKWGKTLLGYPERAHSVWGYNWYNNDTHAPGCPADWRISEAWARYCTSGSSVKYSWILANRDNSKYNWAGITHYQNRYDRLWGEGTTYADTSVNSYPNLRYYYEGLSDPIYGSGNGVSLSKSVVKTNNKATYKTTNIQKNISCDLGDIKINADVYTPINTNISTIRVEKSKVDIENLTKTFLGEIKTKEEIDSSSKNDKTTIYKNDKKFIISENNSKIKMYEHDLVDEKNILIKDEQAVMEANEFLHQNAMIEEDIYPVTINTLYSERILLDEDIKSGISNKEIESLGKIITYGHMLNDIPVSVHKGDNITIIFDSNGVSYVSKDWTNSSNISKIQGNDIISVDSAIAAMAKQKTNNTDLKLNINKIYLVYVATEENEKSKTYVPAWEFWDNKGAIITINAVTGNIVE